MYLEFLGVTLLVEDLEKDMEMNGGETLEIVGQETLKVPADTEQDLALQKDINSYSVCDQ